MDDMLSMTGRDVLFAHWPIEPEALRPHVPDALTIDTIEASAWVGVLAFRVTDIKLGSDHSLSVPSRQFGQVNCRTYVHNDGDPGVYFFSLDTGDRLGATVGRKLFYLPFSRARMDISQPNFGDDIAFRSRRLGLDTTTARFDARYRSDGPSFRAEPGSLEDFLIERYRFYIAESGLLSSKRNDSAGESIRAGEISHEPWELTPADATIQTNTLFEAIGIDSPTTEPIVHYSPEFTATAGPPRAIERVARRDHSE
jgi:uncharacterized protein YqjF (DUF2071 family)